MCCTTALPPAVHKGNGRETEREDAWRVPKEPSGQCAAIGQKQVHGTLAETCLFTSLPCTFACFSCASPGAGRAWPLAGYWSVIPFPSPGFVCAMAADAHCPHSSPLHCVACIVLRSWSEYQAPTKCAVEEACPGYNGAVASNGAENFVDTQTCTVGYASARCASCAPGYYQLNSRCFYCGSSVDQSATIGMTISIGVVILVVLSLGVASLSGVQLAQAVQVFSLLQGAATVGVAGARSSPYFGEQLHQVMTYFNFSQCTRARREDGFETEPC